MLYKKEECPYFLITHNEKEMLQKLRSLGDEDRDEIYKMFLEMALRCETEKQLREIS